MGIIVDIIIIAIIALSIFLGYRKGLIALAISLCAVVISLVVTLVLYRPIGNLIINNTSLDENIQQAILQNNSTEAEENKNSESMVENTVRQGIEGVKTEILEQTSKDLSTNIIYISVIIILFFIVKIALHFVTAIANIIAKLPIIKQFNKVGGIIYGALRGIIIVYVALLLISLIGGIFPSNKVEDEIEKSYITKAMYENNIINVLMK